jgi:hypothetical protein
MKALKSKKYTCCFCSNISETSNKKIMFCKDCRKIRDFVREYGIRSLLDKLEVGVMKASAPPYNI